jgi:hypothetical protein
VKVNHARFALLSSLLSWLSETPAQKKSNATPGYLSFGMSRAYSLVSLPKSMVLTCRIVLAVAVVSDVCAVAQEKPLIGNFRHICRYSSLRHPTPEDPRQQRSPFLPLDTCLGQGRGCPPSESWVGIPVHSSERLWRISPPKQEHSVQFFSWIHE